ncbi:right-handed parallel beta-helix repeat-containing protein [Sphingobacterium suaedae]|uniref:Right-handed parallel beta-helix repeat-containing protein n=1 Tax=Sphingobacterium suaedae TaxID=1686402 RepID=A0ABW5KK99_9SPHI
MKKQPVIISLFVMLTAIFVCWGCKKSQETFEPVLLVNTDYLVVTGKSSTYFFDLLSNNDATLSTDVDWIQLDTTALGKGKHRVGFSTLTNDGEERSGTITVNTADESSKELLVLQEAGLVSIFYVKPDGNGNGRSWEQAANLATALQNATSGSVIHLAEGTYVPSKVISGGDASNPGDLTFEISKNIHLIGGYPAAATNGTTADPTRYKTVFSGLQAGGAKSFHVVTITAPVATDERVVLEGITMRDGDAADRGINITVGDKQFSRGNGGGMIIGGSKVLLDQVAVVENVASSRAGVAGQCAGLYIFGGAEVEIRNSKINKNSNGVNNGGGLWVNESKALIFDSEVNANYAKGTASGVHAFPNAEVHLYNTKVQDNNNTSFGAGIYARQNSKIILVNCLVTGNVTTSGNGGGGVMLYDNSTGDIISSTITANGAAGPGGGIFRRQNTNKLTLINTIVSGNVQSASSSDVDAYEAEAAAPIRKSVIEGSSVYSDAGTALSGITFRPQTMLGNGFRLIGEDNPAQVYGLAASALDVIGKGYTPILNSEILRDLEGESRENKKVMGALVR